MFYLSGEKFFRMVFGIFICSFICRMLETAKLSFGTCFIHFLIYFLFFLARNDRNVISANVSVYYISLLETNGFFFSISWLYNLKFSARWV